MTHKRCWLPLLFAVIAKETSFSIFPRGKVCKPPWSSGVSAFLKSLCSCPLSLLVLKSVGCKRPCALAGLYPDNLVGGPSGSLMAKPAYSPSLHYSQPSISSLDLHCISRVSSFNFYMQNPAWIFEFFTMFGISLLVLGRIPPSLPEYLDFSFSPFSGNVCAELPI